ncbi:MAG TPA: serine/threonine-protein kinase [bacterium]|nr:serine/threonine-protein kinase [bacterium]
METVGRYILIRRLATGGMAEIFLARLVGAAGFEKEVVLKRILPQWSRHRDFVAMLIDEAKIAVRLNHPNIVQVYELSRDGDLYTISMEYVRGWDLRRLMQAAAAKKTNLPEDVCLYIFTQILEGLAYAHKFNVIHRDISPQNILISEEGTVKIADFGIARAASKTHETATGVLKGKFAYMSPEQATPEEKGRIDGRSDLFSSAIVFYEALTGERLFYRGSDIETLDRVRHAEVTPSSRALERIPRPLLTILFKALERDPKERHATAAVFRDALAAYARTAGLKMERERLTEWLRTIFADEKSIPLPDADPTRLLTQETELFLEETQTVGGETLVEGSQTRLLLEDQSADERVMDRSPVRKGRPVAVLIVASIALYLAVGLWLRMTRKDPVAPPETRSETMQALPSPEKTAMVLPETRPAGPPPSASDFERPPIVALPVQAKGYLSVQAVPWGTVRVDGGRGRETPVRRLPLSPGRHSVRVAYEPDGSSVAASITVVSGKEIVCIAKFRGGKELRCGK